MRILAITDGTDWYVERFLVALGERGHEVALVCTPRSARTTRDRTPRLAIHSHVTARSRTDWRAVLEYRRSITQFSADVVMAYTSRILSLVRLAVIALPRVTVVGYRGALSGISMLNPPDWLTYYSGRVDAIVCVSHAVEEAMRASVHRPFRRLGERFVTIHKGYDLLLQGADADRVADRLPSPLLDSHPVCMCIGNDRPIKGFRQLLDAVAMLPGSVPLSLALVGKLAPRTRRRIENDPVLARRVWAPGFVRDARRLLAQADFYIQPTQPPGEGNGNAIAEAMSHALPVITSGFGGSVELVEDGRTGLHVDSTRPAEIAEALVELAGDAEAWTAMGAAGRRRIAGEFTMRATVDRYLALFERLVARRKA